MKTSIGPISPVSNGYPEDRISYDQLIHCMRCGLCLPTCPTFSLFQLEKASPRGRLALMRAVSEGRLELADGFTEAMNLCLGCLACQTVCPAGVPYGSLLEQARQQAEGFQKEKRSGFINILRRFLLTRLVYEPRNLEPWMPLLRLYQKIGLSRLNLGRLIPGPLGGWERMMPAIASRSVRQEFGELVPGVPPLAGRVGILIGCLENTLLAQMCKATIQVLACNGFEVVIPPKQVCCGALPGHIGELELARQQACRNIEAFEAAGVDVVLSDAAGCSAQLKEYGHLLANNPNYAARAAHFSSNAKDITEFLAENRPFREGMRPLKLRVAYDDPCHLIHAQGIFIQPRELLRTIPGLELVEIPEASWCCGSAGTYNLTHVPESEAVLARKMAHLKELNVDVLATANTGCYIQLVKGVREAGLDVRVCHVSELIARSYGFS